jgi:hypothetical protein
VSVADVLEKLESGVNSRVKLTFRDGEVLIADLTLVLKEENLIVFDLVRSTLPDKYERSDKRPHISAAISDVTECERASEP